MTIMVVRTDGTILQTTLCVVFLQGVISLTHDVELEGEDMYSCLMHNLPSVIRPDLLRQPAANMDWLPTRGNYARLECIANSFPTALFDPRIHALQVGKVNFQYENAEWCFIRFSHSARNAEGRSTKVLTHVQQYLNKNCRFCFKKGHFVCVCRAAARAATANTQWRFRPPVRASRDYVHHLSMENRQQGNLGTELWRHSWIPALQWKNST